MKVLVASVLIALLTASAYAQDTSGNSGGKQHGRHAQTTEQPKKKTDDSAYKSALKGIPDQRPSDPWQTIRQGSH